MPRSFVIGDIHGAYPALRQCLELCKFDYNSDLLICLGDVCDGWPQVKESVEELLKIRNLIYIMGNHDDLAMLIEGLAGGRLPRFYEDLNVKISSGAIESGWGLWPFNFDPIWVESCSGFYLKKGFKENDLGI